MRYNGSKRRKDGLLETAYYFHDLQLQDSGLKHLIKSWERYRPDLVSYDYYGTAEFYWLILVFNRMSIFDFVGGKVISLPKLL